MPRARIRITPELIRELIPLPVSTDIVGSAECIGFIELVVDDPSFPVREEGAVLPEMIPTFRKNAPVEFVGWERW